ncbi:MAG: M28 family peptidase [Nannocystaceae bacterium]|nr:M28 family peptidase [Nannocystaceae bacterium]
MSHRSLRGVLAASALATVACEAAGDSGSSTHSDTATEAGTEQRGTDEPGDDTAVGTTGPTTMGTATPTEPSTASTTESSDGPADDTTGEPDCAPAPDPVAPWIGEYQAGVLAALTGAVEALPGVTLGVRSSVAERRATGDYLLAELAALGLETAEHSYSETGRNIYATLPSTNGNSSVHVLGAHFDSVPGSPGANDNATGVAAVLSVARYLSAIECRGANVVFVLLDEEELGLLGSYNFAALLQAQGTDVLAVHTIDQMGWDSDGDRAVEIERADVGLFELYDQAAQTLPTIIPLTPTGTGFTDHVAFRESGFAAVGLTEEYVSGDTTPHYHQPSDALATVDRQYLRSTTILLHAVFASLVEL